MAMTYQAKVDGRALGPAHDSWRAAATDLVNAGYAIWKNGGIKHLPEMGSEIERRHVEIPMG